MSYGDNINAQLTKTDKRKQKTILTKIIAILEMVDILQTFYLKILIFKFYLNSNLQLLERKCQRFGSELMRKLVILEIRYLDILLH